MGKPLTLPLLAAALTPVIYALQVAPNSTCASVCLDKPGGQSFDPASSNTTVKDISCSDSEYYHKEETATHFADCLNCLQNSDYVGGSETDNYWFLYNLRYSVDVCLFAYPKETGETTSACDAADACGSIKSALTSPGLEPDNASQLDYCSADGGAFTSEKANVCSQCLQGSSNHNYISNYITALSAGCQQMPGPGTVVSLSGPAATSGTVEITDTNNNSTTINAPSTTDAMTTGAIVGITVGAVLLFVAGLGLFYIYHLKQKKYARQDYEAERKAYPESDSFHGGSASITPPIYGGPNGMGPVIQDRGAKPMASMSDYELLAQKAYTNNGGYYDRLEQEIMNRKANNTFRPEASQMLSSQNAASAIPTHPLYVPLTTSRKIGGHGRDNSNAHRDPSPQPVKSNQPDSYALQIYLQAAEDSNSIPIGLPCPPPPTHQRSSSSPTPSAGSAGAVKPAYEPTYSNHKLETNDTMAQPTAAPALSAVGPGPRSSPNFKMTINTAAANGSSSINQYQPQQAPQHQQLQNPQAQQQNQQQQPQKHHAKSRSIPSLSPPSVPRIRVPQKYDPRTDWEPVRHALDDPTPEDEVPPYHQRPQHSPMPFGASFISNPLASECGPRFPERRLQGQGVGVSTGGAGGGGAGGGGAGGAGFLPGPPPGPPPPSQAQAQGSRAFPR